jgi:hypothetical protein
LQRAGQLTTIKVTGWVKISKNGKVIYEAENLVVNAGLALIASRLTNAGTAPTKMALGDGTDAPVAADTTLVNELHRVALTSLVSNNGVTYSATFTGQNVGSENPAEFGIFNANSGGTMLCRFTCPAFIWAISETLTVDWTINIGEWG